MRVCLFVSFLCLFVWVGCDQGLPGPSADGALVDASVSVEASAELAPDASLVPEAPSEPQQERDASPDMSLPTELPPEPTETSVCKVTEDEINCPRRRATLRSGVILKVPRDVYWQVPKGTPPPGGWPVALMFQGSLFPSSLNWYGNKALPFGAYYQAETLKELLEKGYAVLTPLARARGTTFWDTNVPPFSISWETSPDHRFMLAIFEGIEKGTFGALNPKKLFALGISSGGYMSSRMAIAYPGRFKALAIHSASYASCSGPLCVIPALPKEHPPTLFLHGRADLIVPISTAEAYKKKLDEIKVPTAFVEDEKAAHAWIKPAAASVVDWFNRYR